MLHRWTLGQKNVIQIFDTSWLAKHIWQNACFWASCTSGTLNYDRVSISCKFSKWFCLMYTTEGKLPSLHELICHLRKKKIIKNFFSKFWWSHRPHQGCPMVALEQILRSAELRICSEALAPKMGLEQIRANICSSWSKYLLPVANPLICQNDMEETPKVTILRLIFRNFLGVATQTPHLLLSKWYGRAPKVHHF